MMEKNKSKRKLLIDGETIFWICIFICMFILLIIAPFSIQSINENICKDAGYDTYMPGRDGDGETAQKGYVKCCNYLNDVNLRGDLICVGVLKPE